MRILHVFLLTFLIAFSYPALAQDAAPNSVDRGDIERLIGKLESDTDRKELISDLKLLLDQQQENEKKAPELAISEKVDIDHVVSVFLTKYEDFLKRHNLTGSLLGKSIATSLVFLISGFLLFTFRRGITRLMLWVDRGIYWIDLSIGRVHFYTKILRNILSIIVLGLAFYTLSTIWTWPILAFFQSEIFIQILMMVVNVTFVLILAALAWEVIGGLIHFVFTKLYRGDVGRVQTIESMVRNIVMVVFSILFFLVLLAEIGINIMPLLAGAGVLGIAIGFGAQNMVKDFLTGFTIVLEDTIRVGDVATVAGLTGTIEKITLRKIQLRDYGGIVYTIPFSEITTIQNLTKEFGCYEINMGVAYKENTDNVITVMREVDEELRNDSEWSDKILEPIEVAGVDAFGDNAVIIKARLKTLPLMQWKVGREYNRRMKMAFDAKGIEIPFPQRVMHMADKPS